MYRATTKKLLSLLMAFAMVLSMIAVVQPMQADAATVEIAIPNGDFETGAFGGAVSTNGAATIVDNKNVHSGNYSVHMTNDGTNPNGTMTITVYPEATDADRTLTMKFWMMIPSGSAANSVHTQMLAWREWGALLNEQYGAQYVAIDGNWYEKTVSVPVPANTGIVQVQLYAADTGTTPYIDDISMVLDGTDLMTNGGLENGALNDGISYSSGSIELIHQPVHGGSYSAHADKATGGMITTTVSFEASANARTMNLSYWLYVKPGAAANSAHNGVFCYDTVSNSPNWTLLTQKYGVQYATPGVWTQMSLPVAVAANTDTVQIQIYAQDDGADFYIDDMKLTEEVTMVNHDVTLTLNQVTGDGTWQFAISEAPANKYYKVPATIDGAACNFLMGESGGIMCVYPNFFTALGGAVPTSQIVIAEGTVLKAVDPNNGWAEIEGADTYTLTEKFDLSYVDGAWSKTVYTTEVTLTLNQVTGDGTWQFAISEAPAYKYYKVPAIIDGNACNFLMGESGGIMCVYPNFFTALGGAVPTESIVIEAGTVLKAVDPNNGWAEFAGADTLTVAETIDLSYVDGAWNKTVYTTEVTLSLNQVTGDGTWQFSISEAPAYKYYKVPAIIDGTACNFLMGESGGIMCVYPNFFPALGGAVPTESLVIEAGTVLKAVDPDNGWAEFAGADTLTVAETVDLSYANGVWGVTVPNQDIAMEFASVQNDGTWQFYISTTPADKYYKVPAIIDGNACSFLMGESGGIMCVYPNFFTVGGTVPAQSLVIEAGAVMVPVDANNGWAVIQGAETLTVTNGVTVENTLGVWKDMSQYANVSFTDLNAADLTVYRAEDQAESNYRSVFAIAAGNGIEIGNAGWGNFYEVAAQVLIDGVETDVVFGMVPADDEGWGNSSAFLLYITGEGYWTAASTANTVTICAGTMIMPSADATYGFRFAQDFTMYKNCDGSWDTTADTHVYDQQNTQLAGAFVSAANCQSGATYKYSCVCGELSSQTFTTGELGDHNYVDGTCGVCGDTISIQNVTISLQTVTADGTWQLVPSAAPADKYYKAPVTIDGVEYNVLVQYGSDLLLIYPNFFTALGGAVPANSFKISAGTMLKAVDSANGWAEIENSTVLVVTNDLRIENVAGKWIEMSKYDNVSFTEVWGADLDIFYQNFMSVDDLSAIELAYAKREYPELFEYYGDDANMTTIGIQSAIPTLQIPSNDNWANFTLLGTISVAGAEPWEYYVMMTPDGSQSDEHETAADNAFLMRFYNGYVGRQATSITIEPGTRIIAADGVTGFVFVDGYTIYRDADGNWSDVAPDGNNPVNKWGLILGDNIGVSFEMNVSDSDTVAFTVNGNAVTAQRSGNTYTIYLAAAQMNDTIAISVNGTAVEKTYSVRGYADIILAGSYGELTKELVRNMLVYGGAAQTYFGYNTENLASTGITVTAAEPAGDTEIAISDDLSGFAFYGATLLYKEKIAVRFYFTADSIEGLTFTVNGETVNASAKDGMYYVEIGGINPNQLGDVINVAVSNGTDSLTVAYSPLVYIVRMYNKAESTVATKALVQALYGYYQAAVAYTA